MPSSSLALSSGGATSAAVAKNRSTSSATTEQLLWPALISFGVVCAGYLWYTGRGDRDSKKKSEERKGASNDEAKSKSNGVGDGKNHNNTNTPFHLTCQQRESLAARFGTSTDQAPVTSSRITRLFIHPVKSLEGFEPSHATLLPRGFMYDREWVVVRRIDDKMMTIREIPSMRRVKAEVISADVAGHLDGAFGGGDASLPQLLLTYRPVDGSQPLLRVTVPITARPKPTDKKTSSGDRTIQIFGSAATLRDEGEEVSRFLTNVLNIEARANRAALSSPPPTTATSPNADGNTSDVADTEYYLGRVVQPRDPREGSSSGARVLDDACRIRAQDGSSINILTEESVLWVQRELSNPSIVTEMYRPNVVVEGVPFPEEDTWDTMMIQRNGVSGRCSDADPKGVEKNEAPVPSIYLKTQKLCDRCAIPTTDMEGNREKGFQPTKFLRSRHAVPAGEGKPNKGLLGLNVNVRLSNEAVPEGTVTAEDDETVLGVVRVGDELIVTGFREPPQYV